MSANYWTMLSQLYYPELFIFQAAIAGLNDKEIGEAIVKLERNGFWSAKSRSFASSPLLRHVYDVVGKATFHDKTAKLSTPLDLSIGKQDIILQIIKGGSREDE